MLRRFNVKNFMSFLCNKDGLSDEFSMLPGRVRNMKSHLYDDGDKGLLKFAAIYGANASGKSNLIKAIKCMKNILVENSAERYKNKYCRIGEDNKNKPTYFEVEISLNEKIYCYGFEIILSQSRFVYEWLVELKENNNETVIFKRDIENNEYDFCEEWKTEASLISRLEIYMEDAKTEKTSLFLNLMNGKESFYGKFPQVYILRDVYDWFWRKLSVTSPNTPLSVNSNKKKVDTALKFLEAFGTGIKKYDFEYVEIEYMKNRMSHLKETIEEFVSILDLQVNMLKTEKLISNAVFDLEMEPRIVFRNENEMFFLWAEEDEIKSAVIKFYHSDSNSFEFGEESDGTQRLWELLEVLLTDEEKIFFIDEIDRCMHPSLTYKFVKNFFELTENKNVQLVVTTHESRLLDFDLLRRDEIWFVEKQKNGDSEIYSLEDYNERFDRKIDKAYLEGRYGGVPVFTSLFPIEEDE